MKIDTKFILVAIIVISIICVLVRPNVLYMIPILIALFAGMCLITNEKFSGTFDSLVPTFTPAFKASPVTDEIDYNLDSMEPTFDLIGGAATTPITAPINVRDYTPSIVNDRVLNAKDIANSAVIDTPAKYNDPTQIDNVVHENTNEDQRNQYSTDTVGVPAGGDNWQRFYLFDDTNKKYNTCYPPIAKEANCSRPARDWTKSVDEKMNENVRSRDSGRKNTDGWAEKTANWYKRVYLDELETTERLPWWGNNEF